MLKILLFYFLATLTGNPLLVLILFLVGYAVLDRQYFGFFPRVTGFLKRGQEIRRLLKAISINPHDVSSQLALGRVYVLNGNPGLAVLPLETAFPRMNDKPEVHYYLGLAYLKTGKKEEGKALISKAIAMDSRFQYGEPYLRLGEAYLDEKNNEKALELLETFCSIHTSSSEGFYQLGKAQMNLGKINEAKESFRKSINAYKMSPRYKKPIDRKWTWKARRLLATL